MILKQIFAKNIEAYKGNVSQSLHQGFYCFGISYKIKAFSLSSLIFHLIFPVPVFLSSGLPWSLPAGLGLQRRSNADKKEKKTLSTISIFLMLRLWNIEIF